MKKLLLTAVLVVFCLLKVEAQEGSFGVTAGYMNYISKTEYAFKGDRGNSKNNSSAFFIGVFKEFSINEKLIIHPEFQVGFSENINRGDVSFVVPITFQYEFFKNLSLLGGPQVDYFTGSYTEYNNWGIGIAIGVQYEISQKFFVRSNYTIGLNDKVDEEIDLGGDIIDFNISKLKSDILTIGVGYRF